METSNPPSLRARQKASTRELILDTATEIFLRPEASFSHEAIALRAGMSARTVYRHFPTQADLFRAMWERQREITGTRFPASEGELLPLVHAQFRHFEEHAALVEAVLALPSSAEVLRHGWQEGHAAFQEALAGITAGLPEAQARWLVAVCQSIFSAPFWQMLRTRGRLSGEEAADAAAWAMEAVLDAACSRVRAARPAGAEGGRDA
jgi:AcrR family transcriptional regulator